MSESKNYTPLVPLCSFIAGISLQNYSTALTTWLMLAGSSLLALIAYLLWYKKSIPPFLRLFLAAILAGCAGYLIASYHQTVWNNKQSMLMTAPFDIQGYVSDVVPLSSRPYLAAVHVTIQTLDQPNNAHNYQNMQLLHYVPCKHAPAVGSFASFTQIKPAKKLPVGDIAQYLRKNRVIHQIFSRGDMASHLYATGPLAPSLLTRWRQWICAMRACFYERISTAFSHISKIYVGLMFFGNKETGADDIRTLFSRWGLAHFLARSGLHIVIFVLLVSLFLRLVPINSRCKELLLFVICLVYDALSWSSVSFLRAWLIALLVIMRNLLGRNTSYLHLLCLSSVIILTCNPCHLTSLDFQLTYALTFTLVLCGNLFSKPSVNATN